MIPIYVPSYNRAKTIKTSLYLDECGVDYKLLLHTEKCKEDYLNAGRVTEDKIIVTGADRGITNQRNWIVNNLAEKGKWYISLDDNISGFKRVRSPLYENKKKLDVNGSDISQADYDFEIKAKEFISLLEKDIEVAEQIKVEYIGFATVGNYFFNSKKYKTVGYVISKAVAIKYNGLEYDKKLEAMEDFGYCAEQIIRNNAVLINCWIKPTAGHYEEGGIGTYDQRVERKIIDCAYMLKKYPDFFRYKVKKGCHPKAELQIRFNNPDQVKQWKRRFVS